MTAVEIIRPGDPRYRQVQHVYSARGAPAAVVRVRTPAEVPEALAFALDAPSPFAVRSGGHGISSIATNQGGTVIDLGQLNSVEGLGQRRVRLGPGARWGHVAQQLAPLELAISSGDSGDVGVGGLSTTGGIGLLGRRHGLTIDHLLSAEIVTADGRHQRVSETENPELFWAVRGAGANFGIVTSFEFEAAVVPAVVRANLVFAADHLPALLQRWGQLLEDAGREISAFLYLGQSFAQATVVFAGDNIEAASRALEPFTGLPGIAGGKSHLTSYATVPMTTGAPHTGQQAALTRTGLATHIDGDMAVRVAEMLASGRTDMVHIRSVGGAINDRAPEATAYAHRHQNFSITAVSGGPREPFDAAWEPVHALMDGIYLSFETQHTSESLHEAFPAPTLSRLRKLKDRWDPHHVFTQNFDITQKP